MRKNATIVTSRAMPRVPEPGLDLAPRGDPARSRDRARVV